MLWEPHVAPAITTHVSTVAAACPSADFSCAHTDAWLQVLQTAATTAQALRRTLCHTQAQLLPDADADGEGMSSAGQGLGGVPGPALQAQAIASALRLVDGEHLELQAMLKQVNHSLRAWPAALLDAVQLLADVNAAARDMARGRYCAAGMLCLAPIVRGCCGWQRAAWTWRRTQTRRGSW